jgi:hypothetical protein
MSSENRFKQAVITTLAKRAANRCSNPDCGAITSGPSMKRSGTVNVGEAAHIFGAHPGSARYDPAMTSVERADLTNAIWLCNNCHKLIDDDPLRYRPAYFLNGSGNTSARLQSRSEKRDSRCAKNMNDVIWKSLESSAIWPSALY